MDSGNSGSIQSSSGGDEEYDSRADSISSLFSPPSSLTFTSHHHHHPPPSAPSFDPLSTYLDAFSRSPPLAANSSPIVNCTGIGSQVGSAAGPPYVSYLTPVGPGQGPYAGNINMGPLPSPSSSSQQPSAAPPEHPPNAAAPPRGSKKRSRASRRAPTTVLTTDTSNFRAMVQEFTGVPSPPFASPPAFSRPRFDLLRSGASAAWRYPGMPDAVPGYLLRPFAQKVPVPFASGSSYASSSASTIIGVSGSARNVTIPPTATAAGAASSTIANTSITRAMAAAAATTATASITSVSTSTTTSNSQHLPCDLGLGSQHQNFLSVFNFQPLLPPSPAANHNSPNAPNRGMEMAPQVSAVAVSGYGIGGGGGRGHGTAHLGTLLSGITASEGVSSLRGGGSDAGGDGVLRWFEGSGGTDRGDRGQFKPAGGGYGDRHGGKSCKLNCTGSGSPDYLQEKGSENVPTRGEGMVDSWICSSD